MLGFFHHQLDYTLQANARVFEEIQEKAAQESTLLRLASHIVLAQEVWWNRIQHEPIHFGVWEELDIASCLNRNQATLHHWKQFLDNITDADLHTPIHYLNLAGEPQEKNLETILMHLNYHAAYHRGQLALLLKSYSSSIPSTDYIRFSTPL